MAGTNTTSGVVKYHDSAYKLCNIMSHWVFSLCVTLLAVYVQLHLTFTASSLYMATCFGQTGHHQANKVLERRNLLLY